MTKELKICKKCKSELPRDNFNRLTGSQYKENWDCRDSFCKSCRKDYQNSRRQNMKKFCVEFLGGECKDCKLKTTHYNVYDFHHEGNKDFAIGDKTASSFKKIKEELIKCILLCANCHRIRHS